MGSKYCPDEIAPAEDCGFRRASYKRLYDIAARAATGGLWAEFGVGMGRSAGELLGRLSARGALLLFDSWKGIPTDWDLGDAQGFGEFCRKGTFAAPKPKINDRRVSFVDGWFKDTLPYKFSDQLGLVHLDCDVYESARDVLLGCIDYIGEGTVLVFDEIHGYENYRNHEYRALNEWRKRTGLDVQWLARDTFAAAGVVVR